MQLLLTTQAEVVAGIDRLFDQLLPVPADPRGPLYEAMRHAAIAGGKRLRPLLVRAAGDLFHVDRDLTLRVGAAVERSEGRRVGKECGSTCRSRGSAYH